MGATKNTALTNQIIKIAGEAGAKAAIDAIVRKTGNLQSMTASDTYKATERRLRALPILQDKVEYDKERLREYEKGTAPGKSKDIVRFNNSSSRLDPIDKINALMDDLAARIAADEHEIMLIEDALKLIENDIYYKAVFNRYILQENDDDIAEQIPCDSSTIRRHRGRLVKQLAVRLYGVDAI